eukprot:363516-Chlamydomonas_euryale.AAC.4
MRRVAPMCDCCGATQCGGCVPHSVTVAGQLVLQQHMAVTSSAGGCTIQRQRCCRQSMQTTQTHTHDPEA